MTASEYVSAVMDAYGTLLLYAMPVAALIGMCNIGINIILTAFFGGGLHIGGGGRR